MNKPKVKKEILKKTSDEVYAERIARLIEGNEQLASLRGNHFNR